jgi:probable blue pigment (indigoidine) exporter
MTFPRAQGATGLAPAIWGTTYLTTTQLLPTGRPLLAAVLRALPAGLVLIAITSSCQTASGGAALSCSEH